MSAKNNIKKRASFEALLYIIFLIREVFLEDFLKRKGTL